MLDRRWRKGVEQGLGPIGDRLRRLGITADALTVFGLAVLGRHRRARSRSGHFIWAVVGADRRRVSPTCSTARSRAAAGRRAPAVRSSTPSPTASPTRCCSAASPGTSPTESPYLPILAFAVAALSMMISYERARAEALGLDARGGLMERAERFVLLGIGLAFDILVPDALDHARADRASPRSSGSCTCTARPAAAAPDPRRPAPRVERTRRRRCARGGRRGASTVERRA